MSEVLKHGQHDQSTHGNWSDGADSEHNATGGTFDTSAMDAKTIGRLKKHLDTKMRYDGVVMTNREAYETLGIGKMKKTYKKYISSSDTWKDTTIYGVITNADSGAYYEVPKIVFDAFKPNSGVVEITDSTQGMDKAKLETFIDRVTTFSKRVEMLKALSDLDLKPTESMANNARRGLELRDKFNRGGTSVGVARARDLSNRKTLSPETVARMYSFFSRHEVDKKGKDWDNAESPSNGKIAWLLWGGDSGFSWATSKWNQIQRMRENG